MTNNKAFQRPSKPSVKSIKKVITVGVKKSVKVVPSTDKVSVKELAFKIGKQCLEVLSETDQGTRFYLNHKRKLDQHRADVLKANHGKIVKCSGTLARRGDGDRGNLNMLLHVSINGVVVDHVKVYDELIDGLKVELFETFNFEARVYGYNRRGMCPGYGIKPTWMPINKNRNEF